MNEECGEDLELPEEKSSQDGAVGAAVKGEHPPKEAEGAAAEAEAEAWAEPGQGTERGVAGPEPGPWRRQKGSWPSRTAA